MPCHAVPCRAVPQPLATVTTVVSCCTVQPFHAAQHGRWYGTARRHGTAGGSVQYGTALRCSSQGRLRVYVHSKYSGINRVGCGCISEGFRLSAVGSLSEGFAFDAVAAGSRHGRVALGCARVVSQVCSAKLRRCAAAALTDSPATAAVLYTFKHTRSMLHPHV